MVYLVFFGLGILHILGLVDSLLLETYFPLEIRERTGPVEVGGCFGGIGDRNNDKLYN